MPHDTDRTPRADRHRGFGAAGAVLAIAGVVLLAGLVLPALGSTHLDSRAARVLDVVKRLADAARSYHADTGDLATEYSGRAYQRDRYHELSKRQPIEGWRGPYLPRPLSRRDNPFGGFVYLYENLEGAAARANGFLLEGEGAAKTSGAGQFVAFSRVPRDLAMQVDAALDDGVPGDWDRHGRVEFAEDNEGTLMVFLFR